MTQRRWFGLIIASCVLCLACAAPRPAALKWVKLGERTVNHALDRDEIAVTVKEGTFRQIRFEVKRRQVTFRDMKVHFANGDVQDVELRRQIPAGGQTRVIDLEGKDRVISKVVFWYNTSRVRGRRAVVELWGQR